MSAKTSARHLIEIHGGTIEVRSDGEGTGATFIVKLPVAESRLVPAMGDSADLSAGQEPTLLTPTEILSGVRVLLVEDDEDTLELLSAALRHRNAEVTSVSSVAEAMAAIKRSRPDVLISDIAMPGEDGYQLIQKVIALNLQPRIPVIAITAYAKEEDRESALAAGYHYFLTKPVELRQFISTVAGAAGIVTPIVKQTVSLLLRRLKHVPQQVFRVQPSGCFFVTI